LSGRSGRPRGGASAAPPPDWADGKRFLRARGVARVRLSVRAVPVRGGWSRPSHPSGRRTPSCATTHRVRRANLGSRLSCLQIGFVGVTVVSAILEPVRWLQVNRRRAVGVIVNDGPNSAAPISYSDFVADPELTFLSCHAVSRAIVLMVSAFQCPRSTASTVHIDTAVRRHGQGWPATRSAWARSNASVSHAAEASRPVSRTRSRRLRLIQPGRPPCTCWAAKPRPRRNRWGIPCDGRGGLSSTRVTL